MSDFRFAGRWLNDRRIMSLSGEDFKAFVTAGTWMVENRTDGRLTPDDLGFIPLFSRSSIPRLIIAGVWAEDGDGWLMLDYRETQTSKAEFEVLENARRADREKKARYRAAKKHRPRDNFADDPRDESPGQSTGSTQARQGQTRRGQDESDTSWATAIPGRPGEWEDPTAPGNVIKEAAA